MTPDDGLLLAIPFIVITVALLTAWLFCALGMNADTTEEES